MARKKSERWPVDILGRPVVRVVHDGFIMGDLSAVPRTAIGARGRNADGRFVLVHTKADQGAHIDGSFEHGVPRLVGGSRKVTGRDMRRQIRLEYGRNKDSTQVYIVFPRQPLKRGERHGGALPELRIKQETLAPKIAALQKKRVLIVEYAHLRAALSM
ncbi:hypothetical protein ACOI9A_04230 [Corynebacterium amycolatum]|uniref:hypothetical protein n=1 Tax=Corynebacterium amycolatum TaxID=43765 RepID=UPI003B5CC73B